MKRINIESLDISARRSNSAAPPHGAGEARARVARLT